MTVRTPRSMARRRRRGEEQIQRLGRRDQDVRRVLAHGGPLGGRRVSGAHGDAQPGVGIAQPRRFLPDFGQRDMQVLVHVDREGPERGDVEHLGQPAALRPGVGGPVGGVYGHEEPGECLSGPGRRRHEDVAPLGDMRPGRELGSGGALGKPAGEPRRHRRVEHVDHG